MCVCQPVVVVEDHDGGDHAGGHHEHDAVEVGPWGWATQIVASRDTYNWGSIAGKLAKSVTN